MPGSLGWVYRLREGERFVAKKQASTEKKAKPAEPRKNMAQLDAGTAQHRKAMGWLIMLWAAIGSVLFDNYVIQKFLFPNYQYWLFFMTAPVVIPLTVLFVWKFYWK